MLLSIKETVEKYELLAKKSLGQNFIYDENLLNKIANTSKSFDKSDNTVVEIGPGPGGLTRAILNAGFKKVIVIEKDSRCLKALNELKEHYGERLEVIEDDALEIDLRKVAPEKSRIISNLPYNIGSVLLTNWLKDVEYFSSFTLMFQKEVALRITAKPSTSDYGRLGIITNWLCDAKIAFDVNRMSFNPPPKVTSSIVLIKPKENLTKEVDFKTVERLTALAFSARRKMLRSSLFKHFKNADEVFKSLDILETLRPENLTVEQFIKLAKVMEQQK
ncbi:MAG: Ribosomal RNA small subunit methyltransferase A [Alphaproteobacteria bacterium ADurb.Bin438]|nr:MAG: Ribosomal RNA small subunit methyltransferase A [Alphaproteobacteria bacterium ADurb.Bin438]